MGDIHNTLNITRFVEPKVINYEVGVNNAIRPYLIFNSSDFKDVCIESIENTSLKELVFVGAIDQMTNVSDAMINFTDWKAVIRHGFQTKLK